MHRLGYDRYGARGGDFGAFVAPDLGRVDAEHVIGVHVNAATMGFIPQGDIPEAGQYTLTFVRMSSRATASSGSPRVALVHSLNFSTSQASCPAGESVSP
jgi:hypothetical protein